jgi:hypothetical protein
MPLAGGNRPPNAPIASQGRNFGRNDAGRKGKPFGKLNCTNVEEVIHSNQVVIGTLNISHILANFYLIPEQRLHLYQESSSMHTECDVMN